MYGKGVRREVGRGVRGRLGRKDNCVLLIKLNKIYSQVFSGLPFQRQ